MSVSSSSASAYRVSFNSNVVRIGFLELDSSPSSSSSSSTPAADVEERTTQPVPLDEIQDADVAIAELVLDDSAPTFDPAPSLVPDDAMSVDLAELSPMPRSTDTPTQTRRITLVDDILNIIFHHLVVCRHLEYYDAAFAATPFTLASGVYSQRSPVCNSSHHM